MKTAKKIFIASMSILLILMNFAPVFAVSAEKINTEKIDSGQTANNPPSPIRTTDGQSKKQTDWSALDWDSEVTLLPDLEKYKQDLDKLLKENKNEDARNLQPVKKNISSDEAMNYFNVPIAIQEVVKEHRKKFRIMEYQLNGNTNNRWWYNKDIQKFDCGGSVGDVYYQDYEYIFVNGQNVGEAKAIWDENSQKILLMYWGLEDQYHNDSNKICKDLFILTDKYGFELNYSFSDIIKN